MAAKGPSTLERTAVWAADLASALHRAHRAGIIHGDVKPANVFVTDEGQLKLGDFGIAKFATQVSGTGRLVGTPAYLSPEQIKGETQDHRSEFFSWGSSSTSWRLAFVRSTEPALQPSAPKSSLPSRLRPPATTRRFQRSSTPS